MIYWIYSHIKYKPMEPLEIEQVSQGLQFLEDLRIPAERWAGIHKNQLLDGPLVEDDNSLFHDCHFGDSTNHQDSPMIFNSEPSTSEPNEGLITEVKNSDYDKNICAYITKKIVIFFLKGNYQNLVKALCRSYNCNYQQVIDFYKKMLKQVFGVNHLNSMVIPQSPSQVGIKKVFSKFMEWFLRNKYLSYILKEGRMSDKEAYISYKNKCLLYFTRDTTILDEAVLE